MKKTLDGFILSRQWSDSWFNHGKQLKLTYWLKTDEGPAKVSIHSQKAVFFVSQSLVETTCGLLKSCPSLNMDSWSYRELTLRSFENEVVYAFYFTQQRSLFLARDFLRKHSIPLMEADIQPTERFLMERFVYGAATIEGKADRKPCHTEYTDPRVNASHNYLPELKVMSLDIETSMYDNKLYSIGVYVESYLDDENIKPNTNTGSESRVFMLGDSTLTGLGELLSFHDSEKSLLLAFLSWLEKSDPDIVIGWNVINFDLRFLQRKADTLGVPFAFGRERASIEWRQSRDDSHHYTLTVPGRAVLDGIDTLKSATFNFESFSLEYVASALLKRGKLIHDVDNRGHEITRLFQQDKVALAKYNIEDCRLVWDIFVETQLISFSLQRSKMTGLALDRFGGSVAAFDNRYLPRLHRKGYVAPSFVKGSGQAGSPGGYVMDSKPGIYKNVLVLDFKSLYPSIIRTFKIDPLALALSKIHQENSEGVKEASEVLDVERFAPGFNGACFDRANAILPDLINELWVLRDIAKTKHNDAMSQAIKILMNSFYGVLGTAGCRFFDNRLPSSITLRGHEILQKTKTLVEEKGYQVIYGDTDSLFVWLQDQSAIEDKDYVFKCGEELASTLNDWWSTYLDREYRLESFLELEFESCFSVFVMPTIRGAEQGSKKRYAGRKLSRAGASVEDEIVFKGLEAVRTDWTVVAREFQRELYRRVFFDEPYEEFIRQCVRDIYEGSCDDKLVYRKRIRRRLDEYQRNVPPHVQAARIADLMLEREGRAPRYTRGGWVQYVMTVNGPEPLEFARSKLDYELYVERQIVPIVDGIVHFLGSSYDRIAGKQLGFF